MLVKSLPLNKLNARKTTCSCLVARLDIERCGANCECDRLTLTHWDDRSSHVPQWKHDRICGRRTAPYMAFLRRVDGDPQKKIEETRNDVTEVYVRFSSDGTVNYKGFNFSFIADGDKCKSCLYFFNNLIRPGGEGGGGGIKCSCCLDI